MKTFVLIATPLGKGGKGGIDRMIDAAHAQIERFPSAGLSVRRWATRGSGTLAAGVFVFAWFLARMMALSLARKCDLVHVNVAARGSGIRKAIVCRVARLLRIRYIVHLHGSGYDAFWRQSGALMRALVRDMFSHADRVIVLGDMWRQFVVAERLADSQKVTILPNATRHYPERSKLRSRSPVRILFSGILGARKGVPELIEALSRLVDVPNWAAVLAGNGEVEKYRRAVTDAGLSDRVDIPGWCSAQEIEALLLSSDILVLPSFAENLPMSVIEGMAAGLAVITTPVGSTPDIVHDGETGLLVACGDVVALAAAIERLVSDVNLRRQLGCAARAFHGDNLEIGAYARRMCSLWDDVVAVTDAVGDRRTFRRAKGSAAGS